MNVVLTADQDRLIRDAIAAGRINQVEDALREALALWEARERDRQTFVASLDAAEAALRRGEGRPVTDETMRDLAEAVKRRGRERLAAERQSRL